MTDNDEVLRLLASIDRRLALLTGPQEHDLRRALETDVLRTRERIAVFRNIDGQRGSPEIAKATGVGLRSVQGIVKELAGKGLVRDTGRGSGREIIVERDDDALVRWYVERSGQSS